MLHSRSKPIDLPVFYYIGSISAHRRSEATAYVRSLIQRACTDPGQARYTVMKRFEGEWVYEIREGGHDRSYLSEILERITNGETVFIETIGRPTRVSLVDDKVETFVLPESAEVEYTDLVPDGRMTEFAPTGRRPLFLATALLCVALTFFCTSLIFWAIVDQYEMRAAEISEREKVATLPITRYPYTRGEGRYVGKIVYSNGEWTTSWVRTESEENPAFSRSRREPR